MKNILVTRIAFLALALGTASIPTAFAQTTPSPAPTAPAAPAPADNVKPGRESVLTADEKAHLQKVRMEVLAANPDLKTEAESLRAQHQALKAQGAQGASASDSDKAALKTAAKEHEEKMAIAMLKIDPTVEPILAKLKAAHKAQKAAAGAA